MIPETKRVPNVRPALCNRSNPVHSKESVAIICQVPRGVQGDEVPPHAHERLVGDSRTRKIRDNNHESSEGVLFVFCGAVRVHFPAPIQHGKISLAGHIVSVRTQVTAVAIVYYVLLVIDEDTGFAFGRIYIPDFDGRIVIGPRKVWKLSFGR
jgi:hypothetical protein